MQPLLFARKGVVYGYHVKPVLLNNEQGIHAHKCGAETIGVARVLRLGGGANVNLCQPTLCQKLKTHRMWFTIFREGLQIHIKKMFCLGGPMSGVEDPKGPAASLRAYQNNSFNNFHNSLFFRNRKTKERPL